MAVRNQSTSQGPSPASNGIYRRVSCLVYSTSTVPQQVDHGARHRQSPGMGNSLRTKGSTAALRPPAVTYLNSLSVLTWNVWFEPHHFHARAEYIASECCRLRPDVICLQEVLPSFVKVLERQPWVGEYVMSDDGSGQSVAPYGVLTLAKRQLRPRFRWVPFESNMGRQLLVCSFCTGPAEDESEAWAVGTVHLESLNQPRYRAEQLQVAARELADAPRAVLCGDFNFCSYRNYNAGGPLENDVLQRVMPDWLDVWPTLKAADEPGLTFDSTVNRMIRQREQMRYDRIMAKVTSDWTLRDITMIGTAPIDETGEVFPSDHFGLHVTIQRTKQS